MSLPINKDSNSAGSAGISEAIQTSLTQSSRSTDIIYQLSSSSWLLLYDACDEDELTYALVSIKSSLEPLLTGYEKWLGKSCINPSNISAKRAFEVIQAHLNQGKLELDKLSVTQSNVIAPSGSENSNDLSDVELALEEHRFCLALQPIVDAQTFDTVYFEALARLIDLQGNVIPAGKFIAQCEQSGFIKKLDRHVLQLALAELTQNKDLRLSLNVSAITATDPSWLGLLKTYLRAWPEVASRLVIEMTETAIFFDLKESLRFMEHLNELGCRIAIDDFGAGYLSFAHLHSNLVHIVKNRWRHRQKYRQVPRRSKYS